MLGIASAPASTITSEQTVARIGRRMNVSTNMAVVPALTGIDRRAVADFLDVGHDHSLAGGEAAADDVILADDVAERHRLLPRHESLWRLFGDEHEMLPGEAAHGDHRHSERRVVAPD